MPKKPKRPSKGKDLLMTWRTSKAGERSCTESRRVRFRAAGLRPCSHTKPEGNRN